MDVSAPSQVFTRRRASATLLASAAWIMVLAPVPCSQASGQTMMLAEPPAPLLPPSLRDAPGYDAGNGLPAWAGSEAPVLTEDGLKRYARAAPPQGAITVYQFQDATGAASACDFLRQSAPYVARSGVSVIVANVKANAAATQSLLKSIEAGLPKVGGPRGLAPLLPTLMPAKGLERDTQRYALGPAGYQAMGGILPPAVIGFDKAAEVITAKFAGQGALTLLLYPTPQIAGEHGRQIEAEMNRQGDAAGTVKLRREGTLLALTTGRWNAAEAQKTVEGIHLRSEVTWDKPMPPQFHSEVRKTVSLLSSILIFCGLGALAAVVLGLFFGGGRAAIRVLQGKPAATEPEFLRIDLSGRPARIQTEIQEARSSK